MKSESNTMKCYKQAYTIGFENLVIVELDVPEDAKVEYIGRYGDTENVYRCDKARVISISSFDGKHSVDIARSFHDIHFRYKVGEEVHANYNDYYGTKPGIYFFKSREEAVRYEH